MLFYTDYLVQYNPPNEDSNESKRYNLYLQTFESMVEGKCRQAKIIKRIGYTVKASCGMFVTGKELKDLSVNAWRYNLGRVK